MYRYIGKLMNQHSHLSTYILTSNKEFEFLVNRKATKRRKLFNGTLNVLITNIGVKSQLLYNFY